MGERENPNTLNRIFIKYKDEFVEFLKRTVPISRTVISKVKLHTERKCLVVSLLINLLFRNRNSKNKSRKIAKISGQSWVAIIS